MTKPNPENKKSFPGGFFLLLLAAVFIILIFQNFSDGPKAKIGFSHQLEHLVNLNLLDSEHSKKVALNDNLVSFSGKFKQELTDESNQRFRFLDLLNKNHELTTEKAKLSEDLTALKAQVTQAADWFLLLSGMKVPKGGYSVVDSRYNTSSSENAIVISSLSGKKTVNLKDVEMLYATAVDSSSEQNVSMLGSDLLTLIQKFRSPDLGIGSESLKQSLRESEKKVSASLKSDSSSSEKLAVFHQGILDLQGVVTTLNTTSDHVRLKPLRSVRTYLEDLEQFQVIAAALSVNAAELDKARRSVADVIWFFNNKEVSTSTLEKQNPEAFSQWFAGAKQEWANFSENQGLAFKAPDQPRNTVLEKTFKSEEPAPNYLSYIFTIMPIALVILLLYFVFSRQMKGMGNSAMNFGKSPAKMITKSEGQVTFKDVAGVNEAKEELEEIVDFLKDPTKFTALGAKIPKGVLCIGSPGTGKTLIAKAVAGEAERPFFYISGSDFVEMFVGVGASRIRDLFEQAKKNAPCIVFIDEIDAVGRHRGAGVGGGHDEREQTLNQLLVEMDGVNSNEGVILVAATNRPDVLDKALLRPGRFDRRVVLDLPDIKGRYEILKVHARKIKLDPSVDLMMVARQTPGASGADLMNILNESALLAARKGRKAVTLEDTLEASDKVRFGKQRLSLDISEEAKRTTAYHESGHAVVGLVVEHGDPVEKVTIIPRGPSLGATHFVPKQNRMNYWKRELIDQLAVLMGGRIAEDIFVHDLSSGAQMDITQATKLARSMVCEWGMTDALGTVAYDERSDSGQYLVQGYSEKNYSEETAKTY